MKRGPTGVVKTGPSLGGEVVRAFVPHPLPPSPDLEIDEELRELLDQAHLALGRLDALSTLLPDTAIFLYTYVRKEAVLSSQIEGTQSSLSDLLLFELDEAPGVPVDDVSEVSSYVRALELGVRRVREGFPLAGRLLLELHAELLSSGRGSEKLPGQYRTSQNWIGGPRPGVAAFVPPPPEDVAACMGDLEKFLHDVPERTPPLIKAALAHVQFETIHPFLDGNGRLGRLLTTMLLVREGILREPMLYLSLYLKTHRDEYYDLLQTVRTEGDWEAWLRFFVRGVMQTSEAAVSTATELTRLIEGDQERIRGLGRTAGSALQVHQALCRSPVQSSPSLVERTGLTKPTVNSVLERLSSAELPGGPIARELTGKRRGRVFAYSRYLQILGDGVDVD
ncbi:Fic family protein [Engelhardtia mirabilis]|uniref:Adenosine monophosphate-protein transferase SoFic n=1 Tax=Engelhardtia mirabilis TaxID=2528011 RepID=A0A518BE71_9BACT|nr:Adenosine monophosphate-protein transferase SoFic [Planctomycetes bacterium Pla133]QDU99610.1 Adenosine monophosphate-protein transferase SoFic [Planctomycetes bacterium Pla86]